MYICGAKGISQYGGFESFVQNLLLHSSRYDEVKYHVACKANGQGAMDISLLAGASEVIDGHFAYCNADCILIPVPEYFGSAQAVFYDIASVKKACKHIKENQIEKPILYILTCRIGPFIKKYVREIHKFGGQVYLNPDGHEWARRKWAKPIRKYWKYSEKMMVRYADHVICDSKSIEEYVRQEYSNYNPKTSFIPYGSDITPSKLADDDYRFTDWLNRVGVQSNQYYLVVGRFVEENNFDIIIREFMRSKTKRKLVILTTFNAKLKRQLKKELDYKRDKRIILAEPNYDVELLKKIRENAYAYIHGHEVGGTNPSLLEGLAGTKLNFVYGVKFNMEVAEDTAFYWRKDEGNLADLVGFSEEKLSCNEIYNLGLKAKDRVARKYNWNVVADDYYKIFKNDDIAQ